jgi:hypothetical protein
MNPHLKAIRIEQIHSAWRDFIVTNHFLLEKLNLFTKSPRRGVWIVKILDPFDIGTDMDRDEKLVKASELYEKLPFLKQIVFLPLVRCKCMPNINVKMLRRYPCDTQVVIHTEYSIDTNKNVLYYTDMATLDEGPCIIDHLPSSRSRRVQKHVCASCNRMKLQHPLRVYKCCAGCRWVYYCSRACQKRDWKTHKALCTLYKYANTKGACMYTS